MLKYLKNLFLKKNKTEEHFPDYTCKGICHSDMRCIDLPGHQKTCTSKDMAIPQETLDFLRAEIRKEVDAEWAERTKELIFSAEKKNPIVRRKSCC